MASTTTDSNTTAVLAFGSIRIGRVVSDRLEFRVLEMCFTAGGSDEDTLLVAGNTDLANAQHLLQHLLRAKWSLTDLDGRHRVVLVLVLHDAFAEWVSESHTLARR
jgi:hypothetical protein